MEAIEANQKSVGDTYPPLNVRCTTTKCEDELHCFLQKKKRRKRDMVEDNPSGGGGKCRACGKNLVEWPRVHRRNLKDVAHTFRMMQYEFVRHYFWHLAIDQKAVNHALRKGREGMWAAVEKRVRRSVGDANPTFDGRQTPKSGNSIYYAQHATATCCRKCIEEWHGIPRGIALTDEVVMYFTDLIMLYINERLPQLPDKGIKVPRISSGR